MSKHILITGGAGFIGSHLADELLTRGDRVRALDNLSPQVHGFNCSRPSYLHPDVELIVGDVRNPEAVRKALKGIDAVYHFAAVVGVGQSMYEIVNYRQALSNPYTGVLAIFASRILNNNPPLIFEDGYQLRDFVSVSDVVQACRLALEVPGVTGSVFNIASGQQHTVREAAAKMAKVLGKEQIQPKITGNYRVGDVRHCFADISLAQSILGYKPRVKLEDGLIELAGWLEGQVAHDRVAEAREELAARGLTV
ncbi:NAD-dependent epimerase/dehydratase family protein [Coleofasciculus sp. G2-EDA-02]|uniref:NAD-dependent epimerase/dehydratase family protein n=1 Tax=Coleofasciculus sp. G2-EDA-02 TaxID=3069529 RepID=UPI0032F7B60D